ncbi:molybdenum cofactor synthesis domain-containing protein [Halovenus aranensis]|jgi:molybdenum cofactor synthesis domain-containing protein|uniref:Molybdenum cofactor synthesis domain-containing protein n=1 Tax=Halovenus aranensis TaxID=890420 RepID=A0A1G8Z221_9EURY|nr:molybdopterin-binding protein [Halovenus aranensis]SDK09091.1 molybdenum cofactor synthesis domain-containing protein [Halovenus aranensis]
MEVALVTVGDEILSGETTNTNAAWLGQRLRESGVSVERMTVVPDRIADIARVVNEYQAAYDAVIVTGGLGPTPDDVTMQGVAAAYGTELEADAAVSEWLESEKGYSNDDLAPETTHIPERATMLKNPEGVAPGCVIDNTYVLPGVPAEMQGMFDQVADDFSGDPWYVETVCTPEPESHLLDRITEVQKQYDVTVGSYPGKNVRLRIEGTDPDIVEDAASWLRERVDLTQA